MSDPAVNELVLARVRAAEAVMYEELAELVSLETPTGEVERCRAGTALLGALARRHGIATRVIELGGRPHLLLGALASDDGWSADPRAGQVLLVGHFDTVWPAGTLASWPFSVAAGIATGPGVYDMKGGIIEGLHALEALAAIDCAPQAAMVLTSDEEVGSPTSSTLIDSLARRADAALVLEPGPTGGVKVARKGIQVWRVEVTGRAAHAGLEPERGVNAGVELARVVAAVAAMGDKASETTVTPTLLRAGSAANVVPEAAEATIDVRSFEQRALGAVEEQLRALRPTLEGASLELERVSERPPLESSASAALFHRAARLWRSLDGGELAAESVGGASDGNLTAAAGAPTLDGLGAEGGGAHARDEHVRLAALTSRTVLIAALTADLCRRPARARGDA